MNKLFIAWHKRWLLLIIQEAKRDPMFLNIFCDKLISIRYFVITNDNFNIILLFIETCSVLAECQRRT